MMNDYRRTIFFFFCLFPAALWSEVAGVLDWEIRVRIYSGSNAKIATIEAHSGLYTLTAHKKDGTLIDTVTFLTHGMGAYGKVKLHLDSLNFIFASHKHPLGRYEFLRLAPLSGSEGVFKVDYGEKGIDSRIYDGSLEIVKGKNHLELINTVSLEKYIAGVVESEGGHNNSMEYLKAQAVLARTFAVKNKNKFIKHGYNLTDDVRSQVYFSKCHKTNAASIRFATDDTKGNVLVSLDQHLIIATFHANSGGYTASSENVWVKSVNYLRSRRDDYSLKQPGSEWVKVISKEVYLEFFQKNYPSLYASEEFLNYVLRLRQKVRKGYFSYEDIRIKFKEMRSFFKLRSAYFNVYDKGENVLILGKGYGHGLGLSQEGAMRMAALGFTFDKILEYYFKSTRIKNLSELDIEI